MTEPDPRDPARSLLFGLLAFQNNFIDRRALLAAFDDWTADKSRPLGRVLADQGALSNDLLALIDGLVNAHLSRHDNEPARSLAALTPIGSVRDDLQAVLDSGAQASLAQVSTARAEGDDPYATRPPTVGALTSAGVRFRILRPLSQGGMGVVSVAHDTELDRSIALKEIQEKAADDQDYRARFLAEAEITGKLEPPGIIPIYGLGTYADGRPFYAMRLIRGDKTGSLMDAIRRFHADPGPRSSARVVEFRGLLGRFLDVCNAIAYAHSKGVLHRDLKPDNILLGPYGETLVVDWGLAKAAGRDDPVSPSEGEQVRLNLSGSELSPTMAGGAFGTPGYSPPEQMTGDLANVGPRSDVYGLGAVLYCLMAGRPPISSKGLDRGELIKRIEDGDFPPPRQVRPDVDKPLEAICLKAMSRKPADRYESVHALAADVEGYLADEPIAAYREPWTSRARRWTKKHRTAVTAAAVALVVAAIGLGAITAIQTKARNVLAAQNGKLKAANLAIDRQRSRAESREAQAIEAVNKFRDAVANEPALKNNRALGDLRKRLLKEPLAFFRALRDRLQAEPDTRPESLARLASASYNLGYLTDEIGDKRDALIAYRESLAIRQSLADANPTNTEFRNDLAKSHSNLGILLKDTGKLTEAMEAYSSALAIWRRLVEVNPAVTAFHCKLALSHNNIGVLLSETGRPAEAMEAHTSALAIRQKLADANPSVTEFQGDLAASYSNSGHLLKKTGRPAEAIESHRSALAIRHKLADANPTNTEFQNGLADSHSDIGSLLDDIGRPAEATESHRPALAIRQKLADANPSITEFQGKLATSYDNIGSSLNDTGKLNKAIIAHKSALAIRQKLAREHPKSPDFASGLGGSLNNLAMIDLDAKRYEEARVRLRQAIAYQREALATNPANPTYRQFLDNHLVNLIRAAQWLGDTESVAKAERELAEIRASDPTMVALDEQLAGVLKGHRTSKDNPQRLQLAQRACDKTLYSTAARLWAEALASDPKLGEDRQAEHRYNAACAAVLAGSGRGNDDPKPDDAAKAKLRAQALDWLKAELATWQAAWKNGVPGSKGEVATTLQHWKDVDADLAGVRDEKLLSQLPEDERKAWHAFWADVGTVLKEVGQP